MSDFIKEMNVLVNAERTKNITALNSAGLKLYRFEAHVPVTDEFLEKHKLTKDFIFHVDCTGQEGRMLIYYKECKVKPKKVWRLPEGFEEPTMLGLLHLCIAQDTHTPDAFKDALIN